MSLIKLNSVYETKNTFYLVFELFSGGNLRECITRKGVFTEAQAAFVLQNLLEGLKCLHDKNIMHRDIKPENILFRSENFMKPNQIVLADFGLATSNNVSQYLFLRCGTPGYTAPEVFEAEEPTDHYNIKCDIFSMGMTLYFMLTGKLPYSDENSVYRQNLTGDFALSRHKEFNDLSEQGFVLICFIDKEINLVF